MRLKKRKKMIINLIKNLLKKNYLGNFPTKALLILFVALLGTPTMAIAEKCPSNMKEMTQKYEQDGFSVTKYFSPKFISSLLSESIEPNLVIEYYSR